MSEDDTFGKASEKKFRVKMCCDVLDCTPEIDVLLQSDCDGLTSGCSVLLLSSFGPITPPPPMHELVSVVIGTIGNRNSKGDMIGKYTCTPYKYRARL